MLAIKLRPVGKKKQISYRIVVDQKRSKLKGRFVEDLGWYNPHTNLFKVNADRARYWMESGAQPTDSVHNILVSARVLEGKKVAVHGKSKQAPVESSAPAPEQKPVVESATSDESKGEEVAEVAAVEEAPVVEVPVEEAPVTDEEKPAQE